MFRWQVAATISALGLALVGCGHDQPANDATSATGGDSSGTMAPSDTPADADASGGGTGPGPTGRGGPGGAGTDHTEH